MEQLRVFDVLMLASTVIWVLAVIIYNHVLGGLDVNPLEVFAIKSVALLAVANTLGSVPCGGFIEFAVYWLGVMWLFKMDFWEARIFTLIISGLNICAWIVVVGAMRPH